MLGAATFCARQRQQLIHRVGGANAGATNQFQRLLQLVGARVSTLRQIGLHAQTGQRCFELVCSIRQKTFLRGDRLFQAREQIVDRRHQRRHFEGHRMVVEWTQIVGFA